MNKMENEFASKLIEEIKTTKRVKPTKPIKLDDLIYSKPVAFVKKLQRRLKKQNFR